MLFKTRYTFQYNKQAQITLKNQSFQKVIKKVETLKIANVTFIPLNVIPKAYKPAFKDVKIPVKPNNPTHEIQVNNKHYVPIKN